MKDNKALKYPRRNRQNGGIKCKSLEEQSGG